MADRFGRGGKSELGEPVIQRDLLAVILAFAVKPMDLTTDLDRQPVHVAEIKRPYSTHSVAHGRKRFGHVQPKRIDRARTRNHDTFHASGLLGAQPFHPCDNAGHAGNIEPRGIRLVRVERHRYVECLFNREDAFDDAHAVDAKAFERAVHGDIRWRQKRLIGDNADDLIFDVHPKSPSERAMDRP